MHYLLPLERGERERCHFSLGEIASRFITTLPYILEKAMVKTGWKVVKSPVPGALRALSGGASGSGIVEDSFILDHQASREKVACGYDPPFWLENSTIKSFPERSPLPPAAQ